MVFGSLLLSLPSLLSYTHIFGFSSPWVQLKFSLSWQCFLVPDLFHLDLRSCLNCLWIPQGVKVPWGFSTITFSLYLALWQDFIQSCDQKCTEGTEFLKNQSSTYPRLFLITVVYLISIPFWKVFLKITFQPVQHVRLILADNSKIFLLVP